MYVDINRIQETHEAELDQYRATVQQLNTQLREKDQKLREKDELVRQKEDLLQQKDSERNVEVSRLQGELQVCFVCMYQERPDPGVHWIHVHQLICAPQTVDEI